MHFLEKWYYVYIMTNRSKTLYTGITGKLRERIFQHKTSVFEGFSSKYKTDRLVYYERYTNVRRAIAREKQIKGWRRIKKIQLTISINPTWIDLAADWYPGLNA
jgi:putative endonuclease